jgi:hypothetical protein
MVKVEKKEKRNQGDHLPPGAVQADIIAHFPQMSVNFHNFY